MTTLTPAQLCQGLLGALEASEGRRRRRRRNTTPDAIGMAIQRDLLEAAVRDAPAAADFECWLMERCLAEGECGGATRAMALDVWQQWRLAAQVKDYQVWLAEGAPSDDRRTE